MTKLDIQEQNLILHLSCMVIHVRNILPLSFLHAENSPIHIFGDCCEKTDNVNIKE